MTISEKNHSAIISGLLIIIATLVPFRVPCTLAIIFFSLYCLLNYTRLQWDRQSTNALFFIASPLILHVLFLWNESSFAEGIKAVEKYTALLFLPVFIIGNYKYISFESILKKYVIGLALILVAMLLRYIILFPEQFNKYVEGIHIWEMGYTFAKSFNNHAPAINMHVAFGVVASFYFLADAFVGARRSAFRSALFFATFAILFFFLLYINTRLALINALLSMAIVMVYRLGKLEFRKTVVIVSAVAILVGGAIALFIYKNPYMIKKYTKDTFAHMDKIGRLDEIDNARAVAYNSLVTRLTIWQNALELGAQKPFFGYGSADSKDNLYQYYKDTNQYFLFQAKLPVHNQLIDFFLKFGIFGIGVFGLYFWNLSRLGFALNDPLLISFFVIFLISNLSDDFLIRFDGIVYSGFWISVFAAHYRKMKTNSQAHPCAAI